ncbi:MAG: Gfo/Idh/MocA family oxidoreductase [Oscillatoriales cyanobacterium SM2_1_8]|nr:Gfo/Idh/MocA family oxidoreductase [Oscillatoriales cyanobacterium SM2_1_8]
MRVGILGTGFGAAVHLPALQSLPGVEVTALWGRDRERTQAIAQGAGVPHSFGGEAWAELLPLVDVVAVTTPPFCIFLKRPKPWRPANLYCWKNPSP